MGVALIQFIAIYCACVAGLTWGLSAWFPWWSKLRIALTSSLPLPLLMAAVGGLGYLYLVLLPWKEKGVDHYAMAFIGPVILQFLSVLLLTFGYMAASIVVHIARARSSHG